jgi:peptidoglycan hydrolase CwlO-like protein
MNQEILLFITNAVTAITAWFFGKRKSNAETDNLVLKNLELSINLYREVITDLKNEIESLNIKVQELEGKVDRLYNENKKLKSSLNNEVKITKNFK